MLTFLAFAIIAFLPAAASARDLTLPDSVLTPGMVRDLNENEVCATRWGRDRRHVTTSMKNRVLQSYRFRPNMCASGRIEIDHRVPRELAGADDVLNLWPMCYETDRNDQTYGAHKKDRLENLIHKKVCKSELTLDEGQAIFLGNWIDAFRQYIGD